LRPTRSSTHWESVATPAVKRTDRSPIVRAKDLTAEVAEVAEVDPIPDPWVNHCELAD